MGLTASRCVSLATVCVAPSCFHIESLCDMFLRAGHGYLFYSLQGLYEIFRKGQPGAFLSMTRTGLCSLL